MRRGLVGRGALLANDAERVERDGRRLRGAGREDGGLAEGAGRLVVDRRRERFPRSADGGDRIGRLRERECSAPLAMPSVSGRAEEEQPEKAAEWHRLKGGPGGPGGSRASFRVADRNAADRAFGREMNRKTAVAEEGAGFESAGSRVVILDQQLVELGLAGGQHPPQVGAAKPAARAAPGRAGDLRRVPSRPARASGSSTLERHAATDAHG